MSNIAIKVDNIGKRYRIGQNVPLQSVKASAAALVLAPFRKMRKARPKSSSTDDFWALRNISFGITQGQVVGVIGRNGAGKSTLLKLLSRITDPTEGRAEIRGRVGSLLEVGTGFNGEMTGRENVYLNGAILGMRKAEIDRKFDEIVAFAEVERFIDTPVKRYSSGMTVRLAFSVAAHLEPEILIIDEVLAVGDAVFQRKCLGKLGDVASDGRTVLFASHSMATISGLTNRCLLLSQGKLVMDGDTPMVVAKYLEDMTSGEHDGRINLRDHIQRKPGHADSIMLTELVLSDADGTVTGQFYAGTPIKLTMAFEIRRPITQFEASMLICTTTGVRLFTIKSGRRMWNAQPGTYEVSTGFNPNYLRPGKYLITVAVHSSVWQDGAYDIGSFEILDNPHRPSTLYLPPPDAQLGAFDFPYSWDEPTPLSNAKTPTLESARI